MAKEPEVITIDSDDEAPVKENKSHFYNWFITKK